MKRALLAFLAGAGWLLVAVPSGSAAADAEPRLLPLEAVQAVARREGLVILAITAEAPRRMVVTCGGTMSRAVFLKRASLVAYAAFQSWSAPVEVVFEHSQAGQTQRCRVRRPDLDAYLADRISRTEFQRRLAYRTEGPARLPSPPPLPKVVVEPEVPTSVPEPASTPAGASPPPALPAPTATLSPEPVPAAPVVSPPGSEPSWPTPEPTVRPQGEWRVGYGYGLGRSAYDAWVLEYSRAVLPTVDVRPGLWMIGGFTPRALLGGGALDGASLGVDMLATSRRMQGLETPAIEGGLGFRSTFTQGNGGGIWPAGHLRVGLRWGPVGVAVRYPLLTRPGDPTAGWDGSVGFTWPVPASAP